MVCQGAVGMEIWAMTDQILFDNFIVTDNENVLQDWNSKTFDLKKRIMDKDSVSIGFTQSLYLETTSLTSSRKPFMEN